MAKIQRPTLFTPKNLGMLIEFLNTTTVWTASTHLSFWTVFKTLLNSESTWKIACSSWYLRLSSTVFPIDIRWLQSYVKVMMTRERFSVIKEFNSILELARLMCNETGYTQGGQGRNSLITNNLFLLVMSSSLGRHLLGNRISSIWSSLESGLCIYQNPNRL